MSEPAPPSKWNPGWGSFAVAAATATVISLTAIGAKTRDVEDLRERQAADERWRAEMDKTVASLRQESAVNNAEIRKDLATLVKGMESLQNALLVRGIAATAPATQRTPSYP